MKHQRNQRLASQLPEIIAARTAWGSDNVVRNVPQGHRYFYWNMSPILSKIPDIFNFTEWEGMLSSRCILNMKLLVTLKYKQRKTSKARSENNLEVRRHPLFRMSKVMN